jgi:archaellum component FlaC
MDPTENQLQQLLLVAEGKFDQLQKENESLQQEIEALQQENQNLSQSFFDLMDAQKIESEQMVQLNEQVWALEEALAMSREKALEQMASMKSKFNAMNDYMQDTLEAATKNASRMELAARVYEMSQVTDINDIDKQLSEFNEQLKPGKLKSP